MPAVNGRIPAKKGEMGFDIRTWCFTTKYVSLLEFYVFGLRPFQKKIAGQDSN
jgi:hypothetical protein